ncbi:hypothetical protein TRIUR3_05714 [Triticum urartu]|uniref:Trichome birefringence-like C-terminal domain-containing protein n=1 Tax=Triticum urartu TaxID=4572 RepID=M7ZAX3_TRIUA|nr:hypothetical protein TRIUR3_05714 [Triticum urartu]
MKHNNQAVRRAASTSGLLLILLLVAFTASNYSSPYTEQLLVGVSATPAYSSATTGSRASDGNAGLACDVARGEWVPDPVEHPREIEPKDCVHCTRKYHYREHDFTAKHTATAVAPHYAVRASFRTALRALAGFRGRVVVRTVAPPHYENGKWDDGGNCLRTGPMRSNETSLPETEAAFHVAQVEEFRAASAVAASEGRFVLMDVSEMMQMRGDAHPGQYGHWPHEKVGFGIDCVHWCLPGPVDAWSEVLLHLLT